MNLETQLRFAEIAELEANDNLNLAIDLVKSRAELMSDGNDVHDTYCCLDGGNFKQEQAMALNAACRLLGMAALDHGAKRLRWLTLHEEFKKAAAQAEGSQPAAFRRVQSASHAQVNAAIQAGNLVRPNLCSECKAECKPVAHHDSYDHPLDVRWLCRSCHGKHHAEHGRAECNGSAS